jgi:hypothetical protein
VVPNEVEGSRGAKPWLIEREHTGKVAAISRDKVVYSA